MQCVMLVNVTAVLHHCLLLLNQCTTVVINSLHPFLHVLALFVSIVGASTCTANKKEDACLAAVEGDEKCSWCTSAAAGL